MSKCKIEKFNFHGDELDVTRTADGDVAVPIRELCEPFKLDVSGQLQKLKKTGWAVVEMISMTASDGKNYETACLHRRSIPLWAATVHASKVDVSVRAKLIAYQRECADVLADHFLGKRGAPNFDEASLARAIGLSIGVALAPIVQELADLRARIDRSPGGDTHTGTIGDGSSLVICTALRDIATMRVARRIDDADYKRQRKCEISRVNRQLRERIGVVGGRVADFPASARSVIDAWIREAHADATRQAGPSAERVRAERRGQTSISDRVPTQKPN